MNDLRLDEVHSIFLDRGFSSVAVLQERVSREVCFCSVLAQVTDTQDRLRHLHHMEVVLSQVFFRSSARFDAFHKHGVELFRVIPAESILGTTWDRH